MHKRATLQAFALTCCAGLAACGGLSTRYANGAGPATYAEPVDVAVVGPVNDGIAADSALAATSTALRDLGLQAGRTTTAADIASLSNRVLLADASSAAGVADPLRAKDVVTGLAMANPGSNSRVIVLHGPIAGDLAQSRDRNWADKLCANRTGPSAGSAARSHAFVDGNGTPTAVVLCSGGAFQSVVYATLAATGAPGEGVPQAQLVDLVERAFTGDVTD
jgi:hypothetical protein